MNLLDEEAAGEISSRYNLVQHDEDNISVTEEYIFDEKIQKGIHSIKFNHNDQYVAAGKFNSKFKIGYRDGRVRIYNVMTKQLTCVLDCNSTENETLVQTLKWRPKIEGRTNNILMTACRDTMYEWHTPSSIYFFKLIFFI